MFCWTFSDYHTNLSIYILFKCAIMGKMCSVIQPSISSFTRPLGRIGNSRSFVHSQRTNSINGERRVDLKGNVENLLCSKWRILKDDNSLKLSGMDLKSQYPTSNLTKDWILEILEGIVELHMESMVVASCVSYGCCLVCTKLTRRVVANANPYGGYGSCQCWPVWWLW